MKFKNKVVYEIRCWSKNGDDFYSRLLSNKYRHHDKAGRLVKRLKKMGLDAFAVKVLIKVPK